MKLPAAEQALVEREKVVGYLLNLNHRYGASKARFFMGFGFQVEAWETFAAALREHGQQHEVTLTKVRTVWQLPARLHRGSSLRILWNHYDQRTRLRGVDERYSHSRLAGR
jgi:hypothetical protein